MKSFKILFLFVILALSICVAASHVFAVPRVPSSRPPVRPDAVEERKAKDLYFLTKRENRRLKWDQCLARKAFIKAKQLVTGGYFQHEDPSTGKNNAWELVRRCFNSKTATLTIGENLISGMDTPSNTHKALMNSPSHRKNIVNPKFEYIGIACYDYVCVELFAGYERRRAKMTSIPEFAPLRNNRNFMR